MVNNKPFVYCDEYDSLVEAERLVNVLHSMGFKNITAENHHIIHLFRVYLDSAYHEGVIGHLLKG